MAKKSNKKVVALLIISAFIFLNVLCCSIWDVVFGPFANPDSIDMYGWNFLRPFTNDSNVFIGIVSLFVVVFCIRILKKKTNALPRWLYILYLAANTCLVLTILTVVVFLAPKEVLEGRSYFNMFVREGVFFHFLNPVLSTVCILALMDDYKFKFIEKLLCITPMVIYAIVYLLNVVVFKTWRDFYGFTFGGQYQYIPIVIVIFFTVTFLISFIIGTLHNRLVKK